MEIQFMPTPIPIEPFNGNSLKFIYKISIQASAVLTQRSFSKHGILILSPVPLSFHRSQIIFDEVAILSG